jgi:uncharacterized lipoprotein YmbA
MTRNTTLLLIAAAAWLAGCASRPTLYYTLAGPPGTARPATAAPLFIELAPVVVPERLARPQLVVRQSGSAQGPQLQVLEQHRWSSSFESELRDALAEGIAERLGAIDVTKGGRLGGEPLWRIAVQLRQFDAVENARVDAAFSWSARRVGEERSAFCQWSASEPVGGGIDALALGAQRVSAKAAEAIARHVAALQADPAAGCQS